MKEIISTTGLTKIYRSYKSAVEVAALNGIDLSIMEGEFIGIMGPSGSGKTTLLNVLSGIDVPTSGDVLIDGMDIAKMKQKELALFRRRKIGYIFQDFNLLDSLTLKENIALPLILDKISPDIINQRVNELMNFFDIAELKDKYQYTVSGGQKQRTAAARALAVQPSVCFADEPTGNLDSKSSANIMKMLSDMNQKRAATILMVTHDAFAASYCKRIIFIKDGKVNLQIISNGSRKAFFDKILETQGIVGGEV